MTSQAEPYFFTLRSASSRIAIASQFQLLLKSAGRPLHSDRSVVEDRLTAVEGKIAGVIAHPF